MMFYSSSDMDGIFQMVMSQEVKGVITLSFNKNDCQKIAGLLNRPVVSIDAYGYEGNVPNVGLDDWQGGYCMTQYLLECGYGPVYVCAGRDHGIDHVRYMGCREAGKEAAQKVHLPPSASRRVCFVPLGMDRDKRRVSYESLIPLLNRHIKDGFRPALFCLSDLYALEALNYYISRCMRIPEDLGIAGFDDIFYASLCRPGLTTVRQDMKRKAGLAVDRLTALVERKESKSRADEGTEETAETAEESVAEITEEITGEILLPVKLVVRGSTLDGKNRKESDRHENI